MGADPFSYTIAPLRRIWPFKNVSVAYDAEYTYCDQADEMYADEQQLVLNDITMKNAYRMKMGLLTSD